MGKRESSDESDYPITHGICEGCSHRLWSESGTSLREFLESMDIPTLMVSGDVVVDGANEAALALVEKALPSLQGKPGGEVFGCVNADLPGGCGRTSMCSACTVRNTVTETYRSGEGRFQVQAVLQVWSGGAPRDMGFLLTTEKVGNRVLVQVEPNETNSPERKHGEI